MIKAVLFDLDGTLLGVDMEDFLRKYLLRLSEHFAHLMEPDAFVSSLLSSTQATILNNDPATTNMEVFMADFFQRVPHPPDLMLPMFDRFYEEVFPQLREFVALWPQAREAIETVQELGWPIVIATNPIFPKAAIEHRMDWAGVLEYDYKLVTSYETMHLCKPNPGYYLEICEYIKTPPQHCLMVGNDVDDDIAAAANVGMKTILVSNLLVNKSGIKPPADFSVRIEELKSLLVKLGRNQLQEE